MVKTDPRLVTYKSVLANIWLTAYNPGPTLLYCTINLSLPLLSLSPTRTTTKIIWGRLHNAKIQIELTALFSVVSGGFGGPIEGTKANFPLTLVVL